MSKGKKVLLTVVLVIAVCIMSVLFVHNSVTDRVNPFVAQTVSYAKVAKGKAKYVNVTAFDAKTGKALPYKIKQVGGYDPDGEYIAITHKGQYVKRIRYISAQKYQAVKNK